jgi:hypothetical protein
MAMSALHLVEVVADGGAVQGCVLWSRSGRLDDLDDPACTTGRAAEVPGVRQAFLRALDAAAR